MSSIPAQDLLSPAADEHDGRNNSGDVGIDLDPGAGGGNPAAVADATPSSLSPAASPTPPPEAVPVAEATLDIDIVVDVDVIEDAHVEADWDRRVDAYGYLRYRFAGCMMRCGANGKGLALLNMRPKRDRAVQILANELVVLLLRDREGEGKGGDEDSGGTGAGAEAAAEAEAEADGGQRGRRRRLVRDLLVERGATIARPAGADASLDTVGALAEDLVDLSVCVLVEVDEQRAAAAEAKDDNTNTEGDVPAESASAAVEAKDDNTEKHVPAEASAPVEGAGGRTAAATSEEGRKEKDGAPPSTRAAARASATVSVCRVEGCTKPTALGPRGFLCADHLAANRPTPPGDPRELPSNPRGPPPECSVDWCHGRARRRHRGMCALHGREFLLSSSAKPSRRPAAAATATTAGSKHRSPKSKSMSMSNSAKGPSVAKKIPPAPKAAKSGGETTTPARSGANQARERRTWEACRRFGVPYVPPPPLPGPGGVSGVAVEVEGEIRRRARVDAMVSACHDAWEAEKRRGADEAERLRRKDETRRLFEAAAAEAARAAGPRLGGGGGDGDGDGAGDGGVDGDGGTEEKKKKKRPRVRDPSLPPARKVVDPFTLKTRYVCSVEGCVKYSVRDGICIAHGAKRKTECKIPGCTRYMVSQGVCIGHGAKRKTTCKVEGCTKYRVSNGVCIAHGGKRKTECRVPGCTKYMVSKGVCIAHGGKRKTECKVEGCTKYRVSNGVCISHGGKRKLLCTAEGCSRVRVSDSMCALHCGAKSKAPAARKKPKDDASAGIAGSTNKTEKAPGMGHKELGSGSPTDAKVDMIEMPDELNV